MAKSTDEIAKVLARMTTSTAKKILARLKAEQDKKNKAPNPGSRERIVRNR